MTIFLLNYTNDNIPVELSEVYVWDVVSPYTGTTSSNYLSQFQTYRTSFNGDLGHLLGYGGGGGIAAGFSGICASNINSSKCYSGINSSYSNFPTYSWSVMVVTHEQGHLMGSRHTHACVWNGNNTAIDGCGPAAGYGYEGSCSGAPIPSGGGTIMSYCHLNSVGINLSLGFGSQPQAVIINKYNSGACLTACIGMACMPPPGMNTSSITSTSAIFNWTAAASASSYVVRYRVVGTSTWTRYFNVDYCNSICITLHCYRTDTGQQLRVAGADSLFRRNINLYYLHLLHHQLLAMYHQAL